MTTIDKLRRLILDLQKSNITAEMLTPEALFVDTLALDSLDMTELMVHAEDTFGLDVDLDDVTNMPTIASAVEYFDKRLAE
ncbi:MAG: phosphopantetheine-binding protein [Desulfobulbus sp.]|nr:phosphopantetheine-binding protein [Desulfobulbus sp.]